MADSTYKPTIFEWKQRGKGFYTGTPAGETEPAVIVWSRLDGSGKWIWRRLPFVDGETYGPFDSCADAQRDAERVSGAAEDVA